MCDRQNGEAPSLSVSRRAVLIGCTGDHVTGNSHPLANPSFFPTAAALKSSLEPMGFNCLPEKSFMGHITLNHTANNTALGVSLVSPMSQQHTPSPLQYSPCSQGSSSLHSMPPPSPIQPTRSPLPPHTPSPVPVWSPSPARSAATTVVAMTPMTQVFHNTVAGSNIVLPTHKVQSQQVVYHHQQQTLVSLQQQQLQNVVGSTTGVQLIPSSQATNMALAQRVPQSAARAIQPKQPPQILPKPPNAAPVAKHVNPPTSNLPPVPKAVNVGLNPQSASPMMLSQGQPSVFTGPQGTFVFNHFLSGVGQAPFVIQGSIGNLLTLRHPQPTFAGNGPSGPTLTSGAAQNATLIAALQAPSQNPQQLVGQAKGPMAGQHTIMIPTSLASTLGGHNLNLAQSMGGHMIHPGGNSLLTRPNFFLAPRMLGPGGGFHFQQIQTPQGPVTIALSPQQLSIPQLQTSAMPATSIASMPVTNSVAAAAAAGQSFFPLQVPVSHPNLTAQLSQTPQHLLTASPTVAFQKPQQEQQVVRLPPAGEVAQPVQVQEMTRIAPTASLVAQEEEAYEQKERKLQETNVKVPKGLNLAELLKEHGIVPEVSPPSSPQTLSTDGIKEEPLDDSDPPSPAPPIITPVSTASSHTQHAHIASSGHQLKLSVTNDGSIILAHPSAPLVGTSVQVQQAEVVPTTTSDKSSVLQSTAVSSTTGESKQQSAAASSPSPTTLASQLNVTTPTATTPEEPEDRSPMDTSPIIPLTVQNMSVSQPATMNVTTVVTQVQNTFPAVNTVAGATPFNRVNHVIVGLQTACPQMSSQNISGCKKKTEEVKMCGFQTKKAETGLGNIFNLNSYQTGVKHEPLAELIKPKPVEVLKNSRSNQQHPLTATSVVSNSISRAALFHHHLTKDQSAVLKPDVARPFSSVEDACQRLLEYHVFASRTPSQAELAKADEVFENVSQQLLERRKQIFSKFHYLMLRDSMRSHSTSESVLVEKFLVDEEKGFLETERQLVTEGKELDFPFPAFSKARRQDVMHPAPEETTPPKPKECRPDPKHCKLLSQRPLKRDRTASPSEEEGYSEPSSKKSIRPARTRHDLDKHRIKNYQLDFDGHHSSSSDEDIMSKIRKELNISPILNDDYEESDANSPPDDSYENATAASGLADFEPPVARTASPAHNCYTSRAVHGDVSYDFGPMSASSDWADMYAEQGKIYMESDAAVESILDGNNHSSELDLEGIDSLEGPLGAAKAIRLAKMNCAQEMLENGGFLESDIQQSQVQNAIKSILHSSENRSYFEDGSLVPRVLHSGDHRLRNVIINDDDDRDDDFTSPDMNADVSNEESDPALDEAVRSILL